MDRKALIEELAQGGEPSIRWKMAVQVLGQRRDEAQIKALEEQVRRSARVQALLQRRGADGLIAGERSVYDKWQGTHWVLLTLADIGYPRGDRSLKPMVDRLLDHWLAPRFFNEFAADTKAEAYRRRDAIPVMAGRHRTCASQQGNALYALLKLGFRRARLGQLAERLRHWQWPDGGWNCDKNPAASTSTFIHTLYSMRGLALYGQAMGDKAAEDSARRAAAYFFKRRLFRRQGDGQLVKGEFVKLHYPLYWHYDILAGLKAFAEIGFTDDGRLGEALDLLEQKELPGGGWPAEGRYYKKVSGEIALNADYVDWGGTSVRKPNPWVTADALYVLKCFGRL